MGLDLLYDLPNSKKRCQHDTRYDLIAQVLGSVKAATDIASLIKDSNISFGKAAWKMKATDLYIEVLVDIRIQIAEVQSLPSEKNEVIRKRLPLKAGCHMNPPINGSKMGNIKADFTANYVTTKTSCLLGFKTLGMDFLPVFRVIKYLSPKVIGKDKEDKKGQ